MGYYSSVAISMYEKDYDRMCELAKAEDEDAYRFIMGAQRHDKDLATGHAVTILYDWVKWYSEFKDVGFVENFLRDLDDYSFKRIGEEEGDIEERMGDGEDFEIYYITQIVTKFDIDE